MNKSEALRLADELEDDLADYGGQSLPRISQDIADNAAAELRRLSAVEAQRDALLEALKLMLEQFTKTPSTLKDSEARIKAHAAIAQTEGQ